MALASKRFESLGLLDWIVRLLGTPKLIYTQAPKYNKFLKANGDVYIHDSGDSWVVLEDRYHDSSQKTRHDCDYTRGIIAGIPTCSICLWPMWRRSNARCRPEAYGERIWPDKPHIRKQRVPLPGPVGVPRKGRLSGSASFRRTASIGRPSTISRRPTRPFRKNMMKRENWRSNWRRPTGNSLNQSGSWKTIRLS